MKKKNCAADKSEGPISEMNKQGEEPMTLVNQDPEVWLEDDQKFFDMMGWERVTDPELAARALEIEKEKYKKSEMIEKIKQDTSMDVDLMYSMNSEINRYYVYTQDEVGSLELLKLSSEMGNLFSMQQLAIYFRDEQNLQESAPAYLYWLNRLASDNQVQEYIKAKRNKESSDGQSITSNDLLCYIAGFANYELGLYYRNSDTLEELQKALSHISAALICEYPIYPGPQVTQDIESELKGRIQRLKNYEINKRIESSLNELFSGLSINKISVDEQIIVLRERLRNKIGEDIWNAFQEETRICLLSSISCFYYLLHAIDNSTRLDFSCAIVPLMKTVEHELRIRFYNGYIKYLKEKYHNVNNYYRANNIEKGKKYDDRGGVVYSNYNVSYFTDYERNPTIFTLGSFLFSTGLLSLRRGRYEKGKKADITMIEYCQERLLKHAFKSIDAVDNWLYRLAYHVESIRNDRNDSAHGGNIKNAFSANEAFNYLILIRKVLVNLVRDCNCP